MQTLIWDCETTSADAATARIVELSIKVIDEKGKCILNKTKRYDPGVPITKEAQEVTGIGDEDVAGCPTLKDDAKKLAKLFKDKDLVGFNLLRFDIPVLATELDRCGEVLEITGKIIDVMQLERLLNPGTLAAVYERYTKKPLKGAHGASADVDGTQEVLAWQMVTIAERGGNVEEMLAKAGRDPQAADWFNKLKYDDKGNLVYNFGKHVGKRVLENYDTKQYAQFIMKESFPAQVKKLVEEELKKDVRSNFKKPPGKWVPVSQLKSAPKGFGARAQRSISQSNDEDVPF